MSPPDSGSVVPGHEQNSGHESQQTLRPVSVAFADYDRIRPLVDGRVKAKGIALKTTVQWIAEFCVRPVYEEFDAAEMSMSLYVAARERGENCIAIPVFPLRDPVWGCAYVRADSSITQPSDLIGKRIGLKTYRSTFALWMRGLFQEHYGFSPEQAIWVTNEPENDRFVVPKNIEVQLHTGKSALAQLEAGEIDAVWLPRVPKPFFEGESWIRRLFPDAQSEMQSFVRRTGISAIGHTIVMNKGLAEREPWIAASLYHAFVDAQRHADEVCQIEKMSSYMDSTFLVEQQRAAYGPNPYAQGLGDANRRIIETFVGYAHQQGYISRRIPVDELFVPGAPGF
ncbi:MAG: hypothetical protein EXR28_15940 [Betaproteobacteria bacterium]|nr:hypothetical protein [Betaproteobacteria bacterium]